MNLPTFQDVHPGYDTAGYTVTNEEPHLHRLLIEHRRDIHRAAAICSGGEIPLLVLLTRCTEVVAVDHSYLALATTYLKATMLATLGAREMRRLIVDLTYKEFEAAAIAAKELLPGPLKAKASHADAMYREFRREWLPFSIGTLERVRRKLDKLTLIHGDLSDLSGYGVFDCLYISNALEHMGRNRVSPKMNDFLTFVKEDGLVLLTHGVGSKQNFPAEWESLKLITGTRTSWDHRLLRKCPPPVIPVIENATAPATA